MVTEISPSESEFSPERDLGQIDYALAQERAGLHAMVNAAEAAAQDAGEAYSLHEVPGIGRYAVVRRTGWQALLEVIRTPAANIDFSVNKYPGFDAIIYQHFASPRLVDPLDSKYEASPLFTGGVSYPHLRENLAAVRNFLMETYYVDTPNGMSPEKAEAVMEEIAQFIGEGLDNNNLLLGAVPNHDPSKPFISLQAASEPGGAGAQYIYQCILERDRHSSWLRPFDAVIAFFGGKHLPDWMLPPAHKTEFTDLLSEDLLHAHGSGEAHGPTDAQLKNGIAQIDALEAARQNAIDRMQVNAVAVDLDTLGNQLLNSALGMRSVASLTEPVQQQAIEIAKDILRKLKISLGNVNIMDGLKLPPMDDISAFGALKGVATVYERLLGYSRNFDPSIMQHPAVLAATRAIGQMGYLAKLEAVRMARLAGNTSLSATISKQLAQVDAVYATASDAQFGGLLTKVERGIETLLSRTQTISGPGAHVGFSPGHEIGSSITAPPTAGLAQQMAHQQALVRNQAILNAGAVTQQTQQVRTQSQTTVQSQGDSRSGGQMPNVRQLPPAGTKQQAVATRRNSSTATVNPAANPANPRQQMLRNALIHTSDHHDEQEEQQRQTLKQKNAFDAQAARDAKIAAARKAEKTVVKNDARKVAAQLNPQLLSTFKTATDTHGLAGDPMNPGLKPKAFAQTVRPPEPKTAVHPVTQQGPQAPGTTPDDKTRPPGPPKGYGRY